MKNLDTNCISLIDFLVQADEETLAKVYYGFCRFAWPEVLPQHYKPDWWNGSAYIHGEMLEGRRYGFILPIRQHIETKIEKSILLKYRDYQEKPDNHE